MGAKIEGVGTSRLSIIGVDSLNGTSHEVIPDRIETGTYMIASAITDGDIELVGAKLDLMTSTIEKLEECGIEITTNSKGNLRIRRKHAEIKAIDVTTNPYPGFPTDMQAQLIALMSISSGSAMINETIFENRFMHVPELCRMGAQIIVNGHTALVHGTKKLKGAQLMATDLRASVSLVIAALAAEGETVINRMYHIDRGYERIEEKLSSCGALIERFK